jgi:prepilin peptidase CpaA
MLASAPIGQLPWVGTLLPIIATGVAAATDARTGLIPNWLTLTLVLAGVGLQAVARGTAGLVLALSGLTICGVLPWLLHRGTQGKAIGGGDVKLFAGLGAVAGPFVGLEIQLSAFLLLGVFALIQLAFRGQLFRVLRNSLFLALNPLLPAKWKQPLESASLTEMRMGPAIAVAVVSVLLRDQVAVYVPWIAC